MRAEFSCFGFSAPRTDGLFFALFPDPKALPHLARAADQLCIRHRLHARPLPPARMHVSLLGFGEHAGLPPELIAAATEAAASISVPSFEVTFDRAVSFLGRPHPLVLCGEHGVAELVAFRQTLAAAVEKGGLGRVKAQYAPHLTLLYDAHAIEQHAIEPVTWTVRDFVLVHSLRGLSKYVPLGRWPLRG